MWQTLKLNDIANISIGKTPPRGDKRYWDKDKDTKNIWLSIADMNSAENGFVSDSKEYITDAGAALFKSVPDNTLIMSFKLSIGRLAFTACELRTNEAIAALEIKNENQIIKEYLKHFLSSLNWDKIAGDDEKVKGKTLNKAKLKELEIIVPPLAEQQRIVAKLDAAFAEIDTAIKVAATKLFEVKKLKAQLLSSMLNDNPVMGKTVKLGDVVSYDKVNGQGSLLPYLGMENISSDTMKLVGEIEIPATTSSTFKFDETHVLYGRLRPYLRKVLVPDFSGQCSTEVFCLKPLPNLNRKFLAYWLLIPKIADKIENTSTGARMPRANMNAILDFNFILPPLAEQQRIVAKLDAAFAEIDTATKFTEKKQANYKALKSALLAQELQSNKSEAA